MTFPGIYCQRVTEFRKIIELMDCFSDSLQNPAQSSKYKLQQQGDDIPKEKRFKNQAELHLGKRSTN